MGRGRTERDDLIALLDEPGEDARRVEAARVGEQDAAFAACGHIGWRSQNNSSKC